MNPNGGAVALGHPIGASGARIVLTTALEMRRRERGARRCGDLWWRRTGRRPDPASRLTAASSLRTSRRSAAPTRRSSAASVWCAASASQTSPSGSVSTSSTVICSAGAAAPPVPAPSGRNTRNAAPPPSSDSALIQPPWISAKHRTTGEMALSEASPGSSTETRRAAVGVLQANHDRLAVLRALARGAQQPGEDLLGPLCVDPQLQGCRPRCGCRCPRRPRIPRRPG